MAIDIFNIPENTISRDLKGRFLCIYGPEKVGKSTFGAKLSRPLFCNFEIGTNYLPVKPVNIDKWSTFKLVLRQLEDKKAHDFMIQLLLILYLRLMLLVKNLFAHRMVYRKLAIFHTVEVMLIQKLNLNQL